jgi:hypothetical protein
MKKVELPDFDDMMKLAEAIGTKKTHLLLLESELDNILAEITEKVSHNNSYFINGKPPSMAYIKDTYHKLGLNDEQKKHLQKVRAEIASISGDLKADESLFKVYESIIGVWRTQSANERGAYLE